MARILPSRRLTGQLFRPLGCLTTPALLALNKRHVSDVNTLLRSVAHGLLNPQLSMTNSLAGSWYHGTCNVPTQKNILKMTPRQHVSRALAHSRSHTGFIWRSGLEWRTFCWIGCNLLAQKVSKSMTTGVVLSPAVGQPTIVKAMHTVHGL